jgi:hypothetical protein
MAWWVNRRSADTKLDPQNRDPRRRDDASACFRDPLVGALKTPSEGAGHTLGTDEHLGPASQSRRNSFPHDRRDLSRGAGEKQPTPQCLRPSGRMCSNPLEHRSYHSPLLICHQPAHGGLTSESIGLNVRFQSPPSRTLMNRQGSTRDSSRRVPVPQASSRGRPRKGSAKRI